MEVKPPNGKSLLTFNLRNKVNVIKWGPQGQLLALCLDDAIWQDMYVHDLLVSFVKTVKLNFVFIF